MGGEQGRLFSAIMGPTLTLREVTHRLSVTLARVADLRNLAALECCDITSELVMGEDLSTPQLVGGAVAWLQCAGMLPL